MDRPSPSDEVVAVRRHGVNDVPADQPKQREVILRAATRLGRPFSFEELLLACWAAEPRTFGLPGYETLHPDARKLKNLLYGVRGLLTTGVLCQPTENLMVLPTAVRAHPRIRQASESEAFRLFADGRRDRITFDAARRFWSALGRGQLPARMVEFENALRAGDDETYRLVRSCHEYLFRQFRVLLRSEGVLGGDDEPYHARRRY